MAMEIRRVVTGRDAKDTSIFTSVGPVQVQEVPGMGFVNLWGTGDEGARVGSDPAENPQYTPFFPDSSGHGTRLIAVHFAPESAGGHAEPSPEEAEAAVAQMERVAPGLAQVFEPDNPGMHTTDTIDYGICVRGEVWLELDDGAEERITPGTVVVQRGTRHAWHNRSNDVATVVYVLVGARRD
ncbi:MAG: cupin domain-containing protein [Pseudonocardia sp.]|jgi:hypothetical protein